MLLKFFGSHNHNLPPNPDPDPNIKEIVKPEKSLILKIIHAGGEVERYYMAFPAASIIDKYPNYVLARPDIFQRPWDSLVRPEEILVPGQKYFVVPIKTVKKLQRRMQKPTIGISNVLTNQGSDAASSKSLSTCKAKPVTRRVHFKGIESKTRNSSNVVEDKGKMKKKKSLNDRGSRKKKVHFSRSLTMIEETETRDH